MRSIPWIGGDGGGEGVRALLAFVGDFGSMMMGGGEVGRFDLRFGVGEGIGSVGWEGGFFDGRTGAGGSFSLRSSIKRWRRIGVKKGASRLPGWVFIFGSLGGCLGLTAGLGKVLVLPSKKTDCFEIVL